MPLVDFIKKDNEQLPTLDYEIRKAICEMVKANKKTCKIKGMMYGKWFSITIKN